MRPPPAVVLALALLLLAPAVALGPVPGAASSGSAGPLPDVGPRELLGRVLDLADLPAPLRGLLPSELPAPFGPSVGEQVLREAYAKHTLVYPPGPDLLFTGPLLVDDDWRVDRNLTFDAAQVTFAEAGLVIEVRAPYRLTVLGSTFRSPYAGGSVLGGGAASSLAARGPLTVQGSAFEGVSVAVHTAPEAALVEGSTFHHGAVGVATSRTNTEVRGSTFHSLSTGVSVSNANRTPELGPSVHDNTFEMTFTGISVGSQAAGLYRANRAVANFYGVSCSGSGAEKEAGGVQRARFEANNLHSNYGEAIAGLRGITIVTPFGNLVISNSGCDHVDPYLGPPGRAQDSTFLSSDDTLSDVSASPNPTSAPPLPLPVTEVTTATTWSGPRTLAGPVVVNFPGTLTLQDAQLQGPYMVGSKVNGVLLARDSALDPLTTLVMRTDADRAERLTLGGPASPAPLVIYRCNCTLTDSHVTSSAVAITAMGGLLTDDSAWRPAVTRGTLDGPGVGVLNLVVRLTVTDTVVDGMAAGAFNLLGTLNLDGATLRRSAIGMFSIIGTVSSSGTTYDRGSIGVFSALDTLSHQNDVFAGQLISLLPILDPAVTIGLTNFTFNGIGLWPLLGASTISSSNFVHNYLAGILVVPTPLVPSSATCTGCWAPGDEAWEGDVTWSQALSPNAVRQAPWAGRIRVAGPGQTVDLAGTLEAAAVAMAGGTLRVVDADLDLGGSFPLGAKGFGRATTGTTGRLVLDNAVLRNGGFVGMNSTNSVIRNARFEDFPAGAFVTWRHGGTYECAEFVRTSTAFSALGGNGTGLVARRILVTGGAGVAGGSTNGPQHLTVEDSAIVDPRGGGLLERTVRGNARLARSNLLGPADALGARDAVEFDPNQTNAPFDARDNWWGVAAGPNAGGLKMANATIPPLLSPWATAPHAPQPCAAFRILTPMPMVGEAASFRPQAFDPSGLGLEHHLWDFGDQSPVADAVGDTSHVYGAHGIYTITLTAESSTGARGTASRTLRVHAPPLPDFGTSPAQPRETDTATLLDQSTDPDNAIDGDARVVASRAWQCSDGFASTAPSPTHRFDGGSPSCTLRITDTDGHEAAITKVLAIADVPPIADFGASVVSPGAAQFSDASTHPNAPLDGIAAWAWDFDGDGVADATTPSVHHTFPAQEGIFPVTLTVTDTDGLTANVTKLVDVSIRNDPPAADFQPTRAVAGEPIIFRDHSSDPDGNVVAWAWDFDGDGQADETAQGPHHTFPAPGDFPVTLTVRDDRGAPGSVTKVVHVCDPTIPLDVNLQGGVGVGLCFAL